MYAAVTRGASSVGQVSYVTATLPYVCLTALLIGSFSQQGWKIGFQQYFSVNFEQFIDPKTWMEAAKQVFYSQGPAWGYLLIFAAKNSYSTDVYAQAWRVSVINGATSFFAGIVVFATLGTLAFKKASQSLGENNTFDNIVELASNRSFFQSVVSSGPDLAFIVYPASVAGLKWPQFWSCLFFLMIVSLGMEVVGFF